LVEDVERARYGPDKEPFHFWIFTTAVCSVFNCLLAFVALQLSANRTLTTVIPQTKWATIASLQSMAMAASLLSLG
jgi:hypothetical protein